MSQITHCNVVLVLLGIALSSAESQSLTLLPDHQVPVANDSGRPISGTASESDNVFDFYVEPTVANHGVAMAGRFLDAEIHDINAGIFPSLSDSDRSDFSAPVDFPGGIANGPDDLLDRNPFSAPSLTSSASDVNKDYNMGLQTTLVTTSGQPMALSGESADDSFNEADAGFLTQPTVKTSGSPAIRLAALGGLCWLWFSHRRKRQLNGLGVKPH